MVRPPARSTEISKHGSVSSLTGLANRAVQWRMRARTPRPRSETGLHGASNIHAKEPRVGGWPGVETPGWAAQTNVAQLGVELGGLI